MTFEEERYNRFALVREMLEAPSIIENFSSSDAVDLASVASGKKKIFLTGEESSRIFPAKNMIYHALKWGTPVHIVAEGARQAADYNLADCLCLGASNSGRTREVIELFSKLSGFGHSSLYGLSATPGSLLEKKTVKTFVLTCGKENAVAATKSVIEEALFYQALLAAISGKSGLFDNRVSLAGAARHVLEMRIPLEVIAKLKGANIIYFAGRNNGVCEELALKTNEITRKKSDFLEGTYAVHGIEEVMDRNEALVIVEPFEEEEEKFEETLGKKIGLPIVAISSRATLFPTIRIPHIESFDGFIQILCGWNLLVEMGIALGIDLDKPVRARKIGNEFSGG
ncbi:MAG TPA: sugar isomerase [Spirochaetia bacterium]|nr:sugar isomerase [Spirochaetia bacterium]